MEARCEATAGGSGLLQNAGVLLTEIGALIGARLGQIGQEEESSYV